MKDRAKTAALFLLAAGLAFGAAFMGARLGTGGSPDPEPKAMTAAEDTDPPAEEEAPPPAAGQNIAIPGYDVIRFRSQQTDQTFTLCNPEENRCFFIVSLEWNSIELFRSGMLPPGTRTESVILTRPLDSGTYEGAILRYECFDLYTQRTLNGAEMTVKLEVF